MKTNLKPRAEGFTIIELMVGMVIALLATIVIFQVFEVSERHKRNTTSGSDAIQTGNFTLYQLEHQLNWAGGGLARMPSMWGCVIQTRFGTTQRLPLASALAAPFDVLGTNIRMAPVLIRDGGGANPDVIVAMAGANDSLNTPLPVTGTPTASSVQFKNTVGIDQNDRLLAVEQDPSGSMCGGAFPCPCRITQVTNTPATWDPVAIATSTGFNWNTGFSGYTASATVANLGPAPQLLAYAIDSANLLLGYDFLAGTSVSIADNIVNLQAFYGISADATSIPVTQWVPPTGAWDWSVLTNGSAASTDLMARIRAIRVAVVARSAEWDKDDVSPAAWTLFADTPVADGLQVSGTLTSAQQKYRYKVFDTTIPLRNLLLANN
jgi:type IV pilus assembly protein PilW